MLSMDERSRKALGGSRLTSVRSSQSIGTSPNRRIQQRPTGVPIGMESGSSRLTPRGSVIRTIGISSPFTPSGVVTRLHTSARGAASREAMLNSPSFIVQRADLQGF